MTDHTATDTPPLPPAVGAQVERVVRPRAWQWLNTGILRKKLPLTAEPGAWTPLYDQAALDAALNLWPRDCRLCAHFTTKTGGCVSLVQCVDSMQFKATAPRQYWISGPNAKLNGTQQHEQD
jgi:hypothetical protein